ncbi:MAG TPA: tetratricopeptide repeat protein, partial [Pyrinomonadaceae bacterium]|nr:tetratricopeptide repeat protein [Pyrinomonadaceae bacterium]
MSKLFLTVAVLIFTVSLYPQNLQTAEDLCERGRRRFEKGDFDEAIADYTRAIELTSRLKVNTSALRNGLLPDQDLFADALVRDRVRVIDPRTANAYVGRGNAFFGKGEMDNAINDYDRAIAILPGMAAAYHARATALFAKKDYERSLADYGKALRIDPRFTRAFIGRALVRID